MSGVILLIVQCLFVNSITKNLVSWTFSHNNLPSGWTSNGDWGYALGFAYVRNKGTLISSKISTKYYTSLNITISSPISSLYPIDNDDSCTLMYIDGEISNPRNTIIKYGAKTLEDTFGVILVNAKSSTIVLSDDILGKDNITFVWTADTTWNGENDEDRCYLINQVSVDGQYVTPSPTDMPSQMPTLSPTIAPTNLPTNAPITTSQSPTELPTQNTHYPSSQPSKTPVSEPTNNPTDEDLLSVLNNQPQQQTDTVFFIIVGAISICVIIIVLTMCIIFIKRRKRMDNYIEDTIPSCQPAQARVSSQSQMEIPKTTEGMMVTPGNMDNMFNNHDDDDLLNNALGLTTDGGFTTQGPTPFDDEFAGPPPVPPNKNNNEFIPPPPKPPINNGEINSDNEVIPEPPAPPAMNTDDSSNNVIMVYQTTKGEFLDMDNNDNNDNINYNISTINDNNKTPTPTPTPPAPPVPPINDDI